MTSHPGSRQRLTWRRWIFWILVVAFVWLVVRILPGIERFFQTLTTGRWTWVVAAAVAQGLYIILYSGIYQSAFETVGVKSRLTDLIPVAFSSVFVKVITPSGAAAGAALFVDDAGRRGESPARAAAGALLVMIADLAAFTLILLAGLAYLSTRHTIQPFEIAGTLILLLLSALLSVTLLLGLWRPSWIHGLLERLQAGLSRLAARFNRTPPLDAEWAARNAAEFNAAALAIGARPSRLLRTLLIALAAYLTDLASLQFLFMAFHTRIPPGVLIAGFAMAMLFWVLAITPQGIGVVEGVMTLVYTSLGVPSAAAAVVALVFRGLAFWIPLGLGFIYLRRIRSFRPGPLPASDQGSVRLAALLTALMGAINLFSAITPASRDRLSAVRDVLPLAVRHGTHLTSALAGFALLLLAGNLWRRKRVAWLLALVILLISAITHLAKLEVEAALFAAGLAIWLASLRAEFHARSDPPSVAQGLRVLAYALAFTLAYGAAGFYLLDRHFSVHFGLLQSLEQTVIMFTQFTGPGLQPLTLFGRFFADSIYLVGAATTGYALLMIVRPVLLRQAASPAQRDHARSIVTEYGRSSLARFTLLDDKSYFFSAGGSMIAFVAKGRIALALGDPIGPEEDFAAALAGFGALCAHNDWQPAFYQVLPDHLRDYQSAGFSSLCIGHEAIVSTADFTLEGPAAKPLRNTVHKLERLGYRAEMQAPPLPGGLLEELRAVSDAWLASVRGTEKRFSLGWFDDDYVRGSPVMIVQDPGGALQAFASLLPEYQRNEAAVDLMRKRSAAEAGMMDFLFVALIGWSRAQGYATFNLGLSALAGVGERSDDPAVERALHYIFEHVNQFYNFKGLHTFKEKFHPEWSPRYLIYPGAAALPAVAVALIRADSGDDFFGEFFK